MSFKNLSQAEIIGKLSNREEREWLEDARYQKYFNFDVRPAAVLIPLLKIPEEGSGWHILFTRRTDLVADHKGQVAFPGGRVDEQDPDSVATALREAYEEIGLHSNDVQILGQLEPLHTISNYKVVPIIGVIPWPYKFHLHQIEVSRIFTIPITWLANNDNFEKKLRTIHFLDISEPQQLSVIYYHPYDGETLWGVSAEITLRLLTRLELLD